MSEGLRVEQHGRVLVVTIDRQERMNALNQQIYDELQETWTSAKNDERSARSSSPAQDLERSAPGWISRPSPSVVGRGR